MILKTGVRLTGITPQIVLAMFVTAEIYQRYGQELVITSVNDSKHKAGSKHYEGNGFDCRTSYFTLSSQKTIIEKLKERLDESYDIVLEKDHIHIEYDPVYSKKEKAE